MELAWGFAFAADTARTSIMMVDDVQSGETLSFDSTESWNTWAMLTVAVTLTKGSYTIRVESTSIIRLPNLYSLSGTGDTVAVGTCEVVVDTDSGSDTDVNSEASITIWIVGDSTVANGRSCPIGWGQ